MEKNENKARFLPFILTLLIILFDQITKALIVKYLPIQPGTYMTFGASFMNDFLRIIHVRNTGVAFSIGAGWSYAARRVLFSVLPTIVLVILSVVLVKSKEFNKVQSWAIAGIIGGGFGNIIDRIFRPDGVVDFIDVKVYGFMGYERWPTWNIADASVIVCGFILIISFIVGIIQEDKAKKNTKSK